MGVEGKRFIITRVLQIQNGDQRELRINQLGKFNSLMVGFRTNALVLAVDRALQELFNVHIFLYFNTLTFYNGRELEIIVQHDTSTMNQLTLLHSTTSISSPPISSPPISPLQKLMEMGGRVGIQ